MKNTNLILYMGLIGLITSCFTGKPKQADLKKEDMNNNTIYSFEIGTLDGKGTIRFADFEGKKILLVNVASECGFTPQYEGLQKLHEMHKDSLVIVGFPCNQFGGQEPGTKEDIKSFCEKNYGVTFLLTEKIDVKGENAHPIYKWLTRKNLNEVLDAKVKWNFNKFLINEQGTLTNYYGSQTKPEDIVK